MGDIKVSVIIPAYNVEKYFKECLDSLMEQTLSEIQIIIVNDGSTDGTQKIIDEYAGKYPDKITAVVQPNGGQSNARNNALQYVRGKYIAFIDADDYVYKDYFEKLYTAAEKQKSDLVICSYEKFNSKDGTILLTRDTKKWEIIFAEGLSHVFQYSPCAKLYLSEMILDNHVRFSEGEKMEDGPFGIITSSIARNPFVLEDYYGYRYRVYDDSTMGQIRKKGISKQDVKQQFPYKGIEDAIITVKRIRGVEYDQVIEYVIAKALAGFVFVFSAKSTKETRKYICNYSYELISKYFPDMKKNPFMKIWKQRKLPLAHRGAIVLFKWGYRLHGLSFLQGIYYRISNIMKK